MGVRSKPSSYDIAVVRKAGKGLTMQATSLANRHIRSGVLKNQFVREIDRFEQCLVNDVERGKKTKKQALTEMKREQSSLMEQSSLIASKGIGTIAGAMQVAAGGAICIYSAASLCSIGALLVTHGFNNMYENGKYFVDGDEDATGLVREAYQGAAEFAGYPKSYGNMAYYGVDLALSGYGMVAKTTTVKDADKAYQILSKGTSQTWTKSRNAKRFKLFRYSAEDYLRGYQAAKKSSLATEVVADGLTINALHGEVSK